MSARIPAIQNVHDEIVADLTAAFAQSIPILPKAFLRVMAKVLAGKLAISYRYNAFTFLQLFVAHASFEPTTVRGKRIRPLVEWGRLLGAGDPLPAQRAELAAIVRVTNQTGVLKAGAQLLFSDTGVIYTTVQEVPLNAAEVPVTVRSVTAGTIGNLAADAELLFANPLANVASARVVSVAVAGADAETAAFYRSRVVARTKKRAEGGALADYVTWAKEVPGVLHVAPYKGVQPGTVEVYVEATEASSGSPDGIPTAPQLAAVLAAINGPLVNGKASRRPANAAPIVLPITRQAVALQIADIDPDTPPIRQAIETAVDEYLRTREPYIEGLSGLPRADRITTGAVAAVVQEVMDAVGGSVTNVILSPGSLLTVDRDVRAKLDPSVVYI